MRDRQNPVLLSALRASTRNAPVLRVFVSHFHALRSRASARCVEPTRVPITARFIPRPAQFKSKSSLMRALTSLTLCLILTCSAFAGDQGYKVTYDGGSMADLKAGTGMKLYLDENRIRVVKDKLDVINVPASAVTEISYGQDVHRRVGAAIGLAVVSLGVGALMALTKSKKHFIGLTWDDQGRKGGAAFQADKNEYRGVLAGLEGITGKKAVNSATLTVKN